MIYRTFDKFKKDYLEKNQVDITDDELRILMEWHNHIEKEILQENTKNIQEVSKLKYEKIELESFCKINNIVINHYSRSDLDKNGLSIVVDRHIETEKEILTFIKKIDNVVDIYKRSDGIYSVSYLNMGILRKTVNKKLNIRKIKVG